MITGLTPYLSFPGTARQALVFYQEVFGGELVLNTLADFGRDDGPGDAIAHGCLRGLVEVWFAALSVGGSDVDPLQLRPWGDHDGQVTDRYGVRWLIGYQG